tara:strand:+ start:1588 stop:1956 length:369 start_codon:yes stop_codon:yes gene_type:complete
MNNVSIFAQPVFYTNKRITYNMEKEMNFDKVNALLDKIGVDGDEIKNNFKDAIEEEIKEAKSEVSLSVKDKILYFFEDEKGKKELVDKVNKAIDIPFLSENVEEKIFTVIFDVIGGVLKKVL